MCSPKKDTQRIKGTGSMFLRGKVWYAAFSLPNGRRKEISLKCSDKRVAEVRMVTLCRDVSDFRCGLIPEEQIGFEWASKNISALVNEFVTVLLKRENGQSYVKQVKKSLLELVAFANWKRVAEANVSDAQRYLDSLAVSGLKINTITRAWSAIKGFTYWLQDEGHLPSNPFARQKFKKPDAVRSSRCSAEANIGAYI